MKSRFAELKKTPMKKLLTAFCALASILAFSQSSLKIDRIDVLNSDEGKINDAHAVVHISGGTGPFQYFWSNPSTGIEASESFGLTEGVSHSVRIVDADGNEVVQEFEVPTISIAEKFNGAFTPIVGGMESVLMGDPFAAIGLYDNVIYTKDGKPSLNPNGTVQKKSIPFIVVWLILGALFFTLRFKFINVRGFKHAIQLASGKFDEPDAPGEVTHFQALATAVSATVGLGNIAGVAVAISLGGPGATFWMIVAGLLGMSSKFIECTLGVKYRTINEDGTVSGGPMHYLKKGLDARNLGKLGKGLAILFAILAIGASFGGGNMFQANQAFEQLSGQFPILIGQGPIFGLVLAILVGVVIIGGIKSIARVTEKIVPLMALIYFIAALVVVFAHIDHVGAAFSEIIEGAFSADALKGGFVGVLIQGFRRAAFSNEAGVGSAAIAHSAAKTKHPVAEGFVALLEPFIDTVVICTLTALVIIFTDMHQVSGIGGAQLTSDAFATVIDWFPLVLVVAIFLFAFSTMISWSYYGLKAWTYVFGETKRMEIVYKLVFLGFVIIGSSVSLGAVIDFSDMMILAMAFPNITGLFIMSGEVRKDLVEYLDDLKNNRLFRVSDKVKVKS